MKHLWRIAITVLLALLAITGSGPQSGLAAPVDAPALGRSGAYAVGVRRVELTGPDAPDLTRWTGSGPVPHAPRKLPLEIWYPATFQPTGPSTPAEYVFPPLSPDDRPVPYRGRASREAKPASPPTGTRFPLVVLSHGYRNWPDLFSTLAEHLASHGYVVAVIAHGDQPEIGERSPVLSFAAVVGTRSADQRFVLAELARHPPRGFETLYDGNNAALLGYSMGGFGALATVGAGYDPRSTLATAMPAGLLTPFLEGGSGQASGAPANVRALVAFAPWGGAPPFRAWRPESLSGITVPALLVSGDADDVSGFTDGVRWIFDSMSGADRYLLVYQGARHNVPVDPLPEPLAQRFDYVERFGEPVWRRDRMLAINAHFVTAFLDKVLKGDRDSAAFLAVPTPIAAQGSWPIAPGANAGARLAGPTDPASAGYWPGFQRRWALGLELHHKQAGR